MPVTSNAVRWLHVSDFHTGKDEYGQRRLFQEILTHVKSRVHSGAVPDFVFITGDLANKGLPSEYAQFIDEFLEPLDLILPSETAIIAVPGNHDVDRRAARLIDSYSVRRRSPRFFDPTQEGADERANLTPRFRNYINNDLTLCNGRWLDANGAALVHLTRVRNTSVGIVALNTAWLSESDHDRFQLTPGIAIVESALESIASTTLRIVVGHHPLDWLSEDEVQPIRSLFARNAVIYLHGHLHRNHSRLEGGHGSSFIALQAGAAFQAREDERWVNGFMWCEADVDEALLLAEPRQWSRDFREWRVDATAFPEAYRRADSALWALPLPTREKPSFGEHESSRTSSKARRASPAPGWEFLDADYLESRRKAPEPSDVLSFFDGRSPRWNLLLSGAIPERAHVAAATARVREARDSERWGATLLTGAGGEGKSTLLMQVALRLASEENWRVIWRARDDAALPTALLEQVEDSQLTWLVVCDEASNIAGDALSVLSNRAASGKGNVHFLLAARGTDWRAMNAHRLPWGEHAALSEITLRGLTAADAQLVVESWSAFGPTGLGRLQGLSVEDASKKLVAEADAETDDREGAFLGAMLRTRFGDDLKAHVRSVMARLRERSAPGGTLLEALVSIAVLHTRKVYLLSKTVLAEVLGCDDAALRSKVLLPLGDEAAATGAGVYVVTRHRAIAQACVELAETEFDFNIDDEVVALATAAIRASERGAFVPELRRWRFLANELYSGGEVELAIRVAEESAKAAPNDSYRRIPLSKLLRQVGHPQRAALVFRDATLAPTTNRRAYLIEWSTAEGQSGNHARGAVLALSALSDQVDRRPPDFEEAHLALAGIAEAFQALYDSFGDRVFIEGVDGAAQIGLATKPSVKARSYFCKHIASAEILVTGERTLDERLAAVRLSALRSADMSEANDAEWLPDLGRVTFEALIRLAGS